MGETCGSGAAGGAVSAALHFFAAAQCLLTEPWPPSASITNGSRFDFVVVGGGTAGCAVAARLAESGRFSVLLLEAGPDPPADSIVPGFKEGLISSAYDWNFTTVNDGHSSQGLVRGEQRQPRGKMLGGSGSINSLVYSRGFPADYDEWAALVGGAWSWPEVLPYFKKTERLTDEKIVDDELLMRYHGRDGEIEVAGFNESSLETERFLRAFAEIGFDVVDDMTYPHKLGAGRYSHTIRDGKRDSTLTALLNKAESDRLFVLRESLVSNIMVVDDRAVGVKVSIADEEYHFYADKEVVVCAGTFNTAKLLMLSGIGPKEHLEALGVDVVRDLPVGDNLHDHVMYLNYIAAESGMCERSEGAVHMDTVRYLYDRGGALGRSDSMGALLALNGSRPDTPDFAFYPTCVPARSGFYDGCVRVIGFDRDICARIDTENRDHELLSIAVVLLKPKSRGKVRLRSLDPFDDPLIYSGTFDDAVDLEGYPAAIEVIRSLAETSYLKEKSARVLELPVAGCDGLEDREAVKCRARALATSAWHAAGTAAMGGVLDAELRVRGLAGLRVADASAMPAAPRGNTNAPVVMIAEKAAHFIMTAYGAE